MNAVLGGGGSAVLRPLPPLPHGGPAHGAPSHGAPPRGGGGITPELVYAPRPIGDGFVERILPFAIEAC
eukprot:1046847-Prymnesium_polylepis.1